MIASGRPILHTDHEHRRAGGCEQALGHAAQQQSAGAVGPVVAADDQVEAVLARVIGESPGGSARIDDPLSGRFEAPDLQDSI
jgi:hypothetical protein